MAKPIEIGLILEGQDALDFEEYMKNPVFTKKGRKVMREVKRRESEDKGRLNFE